VKNILFEIDSLKKEAESYKPFQESNERAFWKKFRLEFNYNSNHLEGSTLTYGHTELLLIFDKIGSDGYSLRELEEMKAHDVALQLIKEAALDTNFRLTEKFIKEINHILLVRPFYKEAETYDKQPTRRLIEPGQYKKYPNNVRLENGSIFQYASVEETPALMGDLLEWIRTEEEVKELHPVQLAALIHYKFVRIHPFDDCNGRTSRLLMNYFLMKNGYTPIVIESSDKKNYLTALNKADTGDLNSFLNYITILSLKWQQIFTNAIKGESIEEKNDYLKEISLLKNEFKSNINRIDTKLSDEVYVNTLKNSILPLFEKLEKTLSEFNSFFFSFTFSTIYKERASWKKDANNENIKSVFIELTKKVIKKIPVWIIFSFEHSQFKTSNNNEKNYKSTITLTFREFYYEILFHYEGSIELIQTPYHLKLTEDQIESIIAKIAKEELRTINRFIESAK